MRFSGRTAAAGLTCAVAGLGLAACGSSSSGGSSSSSGPIKIAVSLPLSGPLGGGGAAIKAGYKIAVNEVNSAGGLKIGGTKRKVQLLITDNRSDPTQAADQTRDDVLKDGVVAILGSTTPAIVNAEGDIAERDQIPLVTSLVGGSGFLNGNKSGWHYYWDIFPSEAGLAKTALGMASLAPNNKKVAVVVTEDPDGQAQGPAYIAAAKAAGDQVVYSGTVPTGTQDFSSVISKMKSKGAQVVLSLFDTPDGAALTKQMHAENYVPKVYIDQEAASLPNWLQVAGAVGEGTGTLNFWSPGSPDANVGGHLKQFDQPTTGEGAAAAYSAAKVLFDAMQRAGSTDPKKVNSAIASTNLVTPMGQIKFASDHLDATSSVAAQWQGKIQATVYPTTDKQAVKLQSPPQGLG